MKRFYCQICKIVKHVRVLPKDVVIEVEDVNKRIGTCRWHESGKSHRQFVGRIHRGNTIRHMKAPAIATPKRKK